MFTARLSHGAPMAAQRHDVCTFASTFSARGSMQVASVTFAARSLFKIKYSQ